MLIKEIIEKSFILKDMPRKQAFIIFLVYVPPFPAIISKELILIEGIVHGYQIVEN